MAIDLVIFDCDGVLVDSEPIAARVLAAAATAAGLPLTANEALARFTGIALADVFAQLEADLGRPLPADFGARIAAADAAAFARELEPVAGVAAMLAALPYRRCVASSGSLQKIRTTLGLTGLLALFEPHLYSAAMVPRGKPAPDLFLHAAREMGVRPAAAVVVEDAAPGIRAARAAGMRVLGFAGGGHCRDDTATQLTQAGADAVFTRMSELPSLLRDG